MALQRGTARAVSLVVVVGMMASVLLAAVASFYASPAPDGLEKVAADQGFADQARDSPAAGSPLADYGLVGAEDERFSVGAAGLIGVGLTAVAAFGLFAVLRPKPQDPGA